MDGEWGVWGGVVLAHFCEMHGPSALLFSRIVLPTSPCYEVKKDRVYAYVCMPVQFMCSI